MRKRKCLKTILILVFASLTAVTIFFRIISFALNAQVPSKTIEQSRNRGVYVGRAFFPECNLEIWVEKRYKMERFWNPKVVLEEGDYRVHTIGDVKDTFKISFDKLEYDILLLNEGHLHTSLSMPEDPNYVILVFKGDTINKLLLK